MSNVNANQETAAVLCSDERRCAPCSTGSGICVSHEFEVKARGLMRWLCKNGHPHMTIIVTQTSAELLEGTIGIQTTKYLHD